MRFEGDDGKRTRRATATTTTTSGGGRRRAADGGCRRTASTRDKTGNVSKRPTERPSQRTSHRPSPSCRRRRLWSSTFLARSLRPSARSPSLLRFAHCIASTRSPPLLLRVLLLLREVANFWARTRSARRARVSSSSPPPTKTQRYAPFFQRTRVNVGNFDWTIRRRFVSRCHQIMVVVNLHSKNIDCRSVQLAKNKME